MHWSAINTPRLCVEVATSLPDNPADIVSIRAREQLHGGEVLWVTPEAVWDASQLHGVLRQRVPDLGSGVMFLESPPSFYPGGVPEGDGSTMVSSETLCGVIWFPDGVSRVLVPMVAIDDGDRDRIVARADMAETWSLGEGGVLAMMWSSLLAAPLEQVRHLVDGRRVTQLTELR